MSMIGMLEKLYYDEIRMIYSKFNFSTASVDWGSASKINQDLQRQIDNNYSLQAKVYSFAKDLSEKHSTNKLSFYNLPKTGRSFDKAVVNRNKIYSKNIIDIDSDASNVSPLKRTSSEHATQIFRHHTKINKQSFSPVIIPEENKICCICYTYNSSKLTQCTMCFLFFHIVCLIREECTHKNPEWKCMYCSVLQSQTLYYTKIESLGVVKDIFQYKLKKKRGSMVLLYLYSPISGETVDFPYGLCVNSKFYKNSTIVDFKNQDEINFRVDKPLICLSVSTINFISMSDYIEDPPCPILSPDFLKYNLKLLFNESNDPITLSLKCPISFLKINIPVRSTKCLHISCFDLESYIRMNYYDPKFLCPICNIFSPLYTIRVDENFTELLKEENKTKVIFNKDGRIEFITDIDDKLSDSEEFNTKKNKEDIILSVIDIDKRLIRKSSSSNEEAEVIDIEGCV